jgi:hypothetical protein
MSLLHREISAKRCLSDSSAPAVSTLAFDCRETKANLDRVRRLVDEQARVLAAIWEEDERRIRSERETFNRQFGDLKMMHNDLCHIICISDHLSSFVKSGTVELDHEGYRSQHHRPEVRSRHSSSNGGGHRRGDLNSTQTLPSKRKTEQQQQRSTTAARSSQHTLPR